MKRLTRKEYEDTECEPYVYGGIEYYGDSYGGEVINKLAEYEDAEEQGLLLRLPCKVGSELYVIRKLCDGKETRVIENVIANSFDLKALQRFVITSNGHRLNFSNFGKTVFLTKEEAEQALEQMKAGGV